MTMYVPVHYIQNKIVYIINSAVTYFMYSQRNQQIIINTSNNSLNNLYLQYMYIYLQKLKFVKNNFLSVWTSI
jgi:ABC-type tungstate transport system permease subunit